MNRIVLSALAGVAALAAQPASAAWLLSNGNADGFVITTSDPLVFSLVGGDNWSGSFGSTTYTDTAASDFILSGTYSYVTGDADFFDPAGFYLNGSKTGLNGAGSFSYHIHSGDVFGFYVDTLDNEFGRGEISVNAASAAVPEPASWAMMLGGFGVIGGAMRSRRKSAVSFG